jgi:TBC1 domain family member 6
MSGISESYSELPVRSLGAKLSMPDLRVQDSAGSVGNFSRPRKQSIRQPVSDTPVRPHPPPSTLSGSGTESDYGAYPWQRPRRPSLVSNVSASTWAPGMSPTHGEFPDHRGQGGRIRNAGPPPTSATRPNFSYNKRTESSISGPTHGTAPWVNGDEVRSSFRSHLTASSTPGTTTTERSSVITKDSSATSLDAHAEADGDADEPSLEDVLDMYEQDFDDDEQEHKAWPEEQDHYAVQPDIPSPSPNRHQQPTERVAETQEDKANIALDLPKPSRLDAEIRQSKLFFTSPAFMASVSHLSMAMSPDELKDGEKRDSGKSLDSDPSEISQPTATPSKESISSPHESMAPSSRQESPSPAPTTESRVKVRDELDFDPPRDPSYPESCPPPIIAGPAEPEDPGFRDRYGFKKETQNVTRKQYDKWNAGYTPYLARRKKKWQAYLKENSLMTENPNRFPSPSVKTKKFVRKGIPPEWRGAAWFYYAGGPAILAKHSGLYGRLLDKHAKRVDVEAIERDLHRTFPDNIKFKFPPAEPSVDGDPESPPRQREPPIIASLRRVLFAFSIYNPHIGYCQSLNFIAGLLLLFVETEEQCFWLLNVITHIYLPGTHEISLEGSKVDLGVLMTEIRDTMPAVWDKIGGELEGNPNGRPSVSKSLRRHKSRFRRKEPEELPTERLPPITLCMTAWFMSCFIGTLPIETTLRVWDVFFYEGSKTLFRTALAIFKAGEAEILAVTDPMEMFGVVQAMPRRMLDANSLIEACFKRRNGFNHLSQGAIDERRQERRDQVQSDRDGRSRSTPSGNVTENESEVRRKGTLFKRNKTASSKLEV